MTLSALLQRITESDTALDRLLGSDLVLCMDISTSKYGHLKYTVKLADLLALGASLTGDITLDTLPPGTVIHAGSIHASTVVAGGSISAATAQLKLNTTLLGPAAANVFTGAGAENTAGLFLAAVGTQIGVSNLGSNSTLKLAMTTVTAFLNTATQGQIDVVVTYSVLGT